jgi:hypothetical protein
MLSRSGGSARCFGNSAAPGAVALSAPCPLARAHMRRGTSWVVADDEDA